MKFAIIDCGTNTFNLLIAEVHQQRFTILHDEKQSVKLGEGGITKKIIQPEALARGLKTMQYYKQQCEEKNVERIFAFATSAVRDARNGKDFADEVEKITGIKIEIISGEVEATYIYSGAMMAIPPTKETICIMDIGGGSCEFIIANAKKCLWQKSFNIGAARVLMQFNPSDPYTAEEIQHITSHFQHELQELFINLQRYQPSVLVGCSGSFESFAEIINQHRQLQLNWNTITSFSFTQEDISWLYQLLIASTMQQRLQLKGLVHYRADTIVLAILLVNEIIKKASFKQVLLSCYALKEGVLKQLTDQQ